MFKKLKKAATSGLKSVGNAVKSGVSSTLSIAKDVVDETAAGVRSAGRTTDDFVNKNLGGWENAGTMGLYGQGKKALEVGDLMLNGPDIPDPTVAAQAAAGAEKGAEGVQTDENAGRRKRNRRNGLRIDLNTGGAPSGNGVNLPRG